MRLPTAELTISSDTRTLPLYELAWQQKQHCMAIPDVVIAGVGTRVCYNSPQGDTNGNTYAK